jgi:hypothetical protein
MSSLIRLQQTAPQGAPPAGCNSIFINTSGQLCTLDSGGNVAILQPAALFVDQPAQNLSAAVTQPFCTSFAFARLAAKFILGAGSGAYAVNLTLPVAGMNTPAIIEANIELPAGSNPTVNIYDTGTDGALLAQIINPAPAAAAYFYAQFKFGADAHWYKQFSLWN